MKKFFLISGFILGLVLPAIAQVRLGMSAGPNASFWSWELLEIGYKLDYKPAIAWRSMLMGEWQVCPWLGLRAETGVQTKANRMVSYLLFDDMGNSKGSKFVLRENLQYWESSLLARISPLKKLRSLYVISGASYGWLQYGWTKSRGSESGHKLKAQRDPIDIQSPNWNREALAVDLGLGWNFKLDKVSNLNIESRFQSNRSNLTTSNDVKAGVHSLFLQFAYLHRL